MKRIVLFAALLTASPSFAAGPAVTAFNGHLLSIEAALTEAPKGAVPSHVEEKAVRVCQSVQRQAELQDYTQVSGMRYAFTYLCL